MSLKINNQLTVYQQNQDSLQNKVLIKKRYTLALILYLLKHFAPNKEVLIYGFDACHYIEVAQTLEERNDESTRVSW